MCRIIIAHLLRPKNATLFEVLINVICHFNFLIFMISKAMLFHLLSRKRLTLLLKIKLKVTSSQMGLFFE